MIQNMQYPDGATPLDPNELGGLKHKHITKQNELNQLEQANIKSRLRWLGRQRADILTDSFATNLAHALVRRCLGLGGNVSKDRKKRRH